MSRLASWLIFVVALRVAFCQDTGSLSGESKTMPLPALPFYDWNVCPGEGCIYRQWTALKQIVVYNTCKEKRRPIAQLSPGEKVVAITGVVITFKPGVIQLNRDLPEQQLKRGDTLLTYTYFGEGGSAVGLKGRYYPEFDISFTTWPDGGGCGGNSCAATYKDLGKNAWWAKVRLKSGQTGWVDVDTADFRGMCALDQ